MSGHIQCERHQYGSYVCIMYYFWQLWSIVGNIPLERYKYEHQSSTLKMHDVKNESIQFQEDFNGDAYLGTCKYEAESWMTMQVMS